jgi:hypothetical protein
MRACKSQAIARQSAAWLQNTVAFARLPGHAHVSCLSTKIGLINAKYSRMKEMGIEQIRSFNNRLI